MTSPAAPHAAPPLHRLAEWPAATAQDGLLALLGALASLLPLRVFATDPHGDALFLAPAWFERGEPHDDARRLQAEWQSLLPLPVDAQQLERRLEPRHRLRARRTDKGWIGLVEPADGVETDAALDEFFAMASHELRSPLNAIRGWAHVLRGAGPLGAQQQRALDAIDRSVATQARQIDDLLDHRRLHHGPAPLQTQAVLLEPLIDEVVESLRPAADGKQLALQARHGGTATALRADPGRLRQVFVNLLANALRFTPSGGQVELSSGSRPGWVAVEVKDSGIGLGAEWLARVFDPQRPANAGLGLSLARRIVDLHGGRLSAHSEGPGRGATFVVELPAG